MLNGNGYRANVPATEYKKVKDPGPFRAVERGGVANKTTAGGERWYSHSDVVNVLTSGQLYDNNSAILIWQDSTVTQRFSSQGGGTTMGTINFSSLTQSISPIFQYFNDKDVYVDENGTPIPGLIQITGIEDYRVDSIAFGGLYVQSPYRPDTVVDTLILGVAPVTGYTYLLRGNPQVPRVGEYLPPNKDTLYGYGILEVDSVERTAGGPNAIVWKVPLTKDMRVDLDTVTQFDYFVYEVPNGGLNVPAGVDVAVTVTFKSGDTWTPNVDSVTHFHRFMPISSEASSGGLMPNYYYEYADRNMSGLLFSTSPDRYLPSILIEAINTTQFRFEFHRIMAHIVCPTCETYVGVNEVSSDVTVGTPYPNPARTEVNIPFSVKGKADVTVRLTNLIGQNVATQHVGSFANGQSGKAVISTVGITPGVYVYTVEAGDQRATGRVVIAH